MNRHYKVLICGAGPCGLAVSYILNQFGISNLIVEKHQGLSNHPKARGVNVRSMELMRNWGLEDKIRCHELSQKSRKIVWMDKITGKVLGEVGLKEELFKYSPTTGCSVPQNFIEEILAEALTSCEYSDLHFSIKLLRFTQLTNHIECQLQDVKSNETFPVTCDYLIGADGSYSVIRDQLQIPMIGNANLGTYLTIYAQTDLAPWLADKQAVVYTFASETQMGRFLMAVDLKSQWIFGQRLLDANTTITPDYCKSIIQSFVQNEQVDAKIISSSTWDMAALNAEYYGKGRIFLIGDAAHRMPPTGGMGMNTGLADAHNLAWKLAYVLKGYANESLLQSYEAERKPLAHFTLEWSAHNAKRMFKMIEAYQEGHLDLFEQLIKDQELHINHPGLDLGMVYRSQAIYADEQTPIEIDPEHYVPSSMPGMRAPHCEIVVNGEKKSTLNLYQNDYVLLVSEHANLSHYRLPIPDTYPLKIYRHKLDIEDPNHDLIPNYNLDEYEAVLVRPDGHIAWRH